jgi:hypothetical protein
MTDAATAVQPVYAPVGLSQLICSVDLMARTQEDAPCHDP